MNRVMHNICIKHERTLKYGLLDWHQSCSEKGIVKFYQTGRTRSFFTKHFQHVVFRKLLGWKLEKSTARQYMRYFGVFKRSPLNMTGWKELDSDVVQRSDGQVVQQFKSSQLNLPNPNPDHDRTGQSVVRDERRTASGRRKTSRSQEIETRSLHEKAVIHDRTEKPVVGRDTSH